MYPIDTESAMTSALESVVEGERAGPGMQQEAVGDGGKRALNFDDKEGSLQPNVVGEYFAEQQMPSEGQYVVVFPHWRARAAAGMRVVRRVKILISMVWDLEYLVIWIFTIS